MGLEAEVYSSPRPQDSTGKPQPTNAQNTPASASEPSQPATTSATTAASATSLPPQALDLAARLFDSARQGQTDTLAQYITAGIPPNLTNSSGDSLLMLAAYHNQPATVRLLLSKGADANVLNGRGQSPVAGAVFKGYEEVVRVLVEEGSSDVRAGQPSAVETAGMFRRWGEARVMGCEGEVRGLAEAGLDPVGRGDVGYGGGHGEG